MSSSKAERNLKILVVGPSNAGKSALVQRYADDVFDPGTTATIGMDYRTKRLSVHGTTYRIILLDTAGQERFRALTPSHYRGADGIVFVYDLTNRASFDQMDSWYAEAAAKTAGTRAGSTVTSKSIACQYCLAAAKLDQAATARVVTYAEGAALARKHVPVSDNDDDDDDNKEPIFFETSAQDGTHVRELFVALVDRIVQADARHSKPVSQPERADKAVSLSPTSQASGWTGYVPGCSC